MQSQNMLADGFSDKLHARVCLLQVFYIKYLLTNCRLASVKALLQLPLFYFINRNILIQLWGKGEFFSAIVHLHVASVKRGFLFLFVLGIVCAILLWHSLCLQYIYFGVMKSSSVSFLCF